MRIVLEQTSRYAVFVCVNLCHSACLALQNTGRRLNRYRSPRLAMGFLTPVGCRPGLTLLWSASLFSCAAASSSPRCVSGIGSPLIVRFAGSLCLHAALYSLQPSTPLKYELCAEIDVFNDDHSTVVAWRVLFFAPRLFAIRWKFCCILVNCMPTSGL